MPIELPLPVENELKPVKLAARRRSWRIAGDLPASFRYAAQGLGYAFSSQRNFRIHVVIGAVVFGMAVVLQLDLIRMAVLALTVTAVLVLELLNTAIEAVVDLAIVVVTTLARIAKDCAAAVLVAAIGSLAPCSSLPPSSSPISRFRRCCWSSTTRRLRLAWCSASVSWLITPSLRISRCTAQRPHPGADPRTEAVPSALAWSGRPDLSGVCLEVLQDLSPYSTQGLSGHQAIAQVHGGRVVLPANRCMAKPPRAAVAKGCSRLPQPRSHPLPPLIAERSSLPDAWR